ncbi:hypothetical protein PoB_003753400 [Plakobranchus ocellatus]|uniref:Uncharacterized protein n=1 Tax=Plakobranchus ocellatus TaxID=259542 RepID=A0AAV4AT98_9GAST|nr:hypothetical protein PoB_003753400 [Plakobranchus ocellatus]
METVGRYHSVKPISLFNPAGKEKCKDICLKSAATISLPNRAMEENCMVVFYPSTQNRQEGSSKGRYLSSALLYAARKETAKEYTLAHLHPQHRQEPSFRNPFHVSRVMEHRTWFCQLGGPLFTNQEDLFVPTKRTYMYQPGGSLCTSQEDLFVPTRRRCLYQLGGHVCTNQKDLYVPARRTCLYQPETRLLILCCVP